MLVCRPGEPNQIGLRMFRTAGLHRDGADAAGDEAEYSQSDWIAPRSHAGSRGTNSGSSRLRFPPATLISSSWKRWP